MFCRGYDCERNEDGCCCDEGDIEITADTHQCDSYYPKYIPAEEEK